MNSALSNKEVLTNPEPGTHFVQIYQDGETLVEAVSHFVIDQLQPTEAIVIIATESHREAIESSLVNQGVALEDAINRGQFNFIEADSLLDSFMTGGVFDADKAETILRQIIDKVRQGYVTIRAFGEMVDILWQRDDKENAKALEKLWNKLLKEYPVSLLCAYRMDNLHPASYPHDIECLCGSHTHFLPSQDFAVLDRALAKAAENVMGVSLSGMMDSIGRFKHPTTNMPAAQASLLYISKTMPITTEFILHQLRKHLSTTQGPV